jgi:hypothetical protein
MGVQSIVQPPASAQVTHPAAAKAASAAVTEQAVADTASTQKPDNYGYGSSAGYEFDFGPSTVDPGSMAGLLAWLGGSPGGQTLQQQQQSYLDTYRQRYPNGVTGVNNYISATTNYLTHTS